MSDTAKPSVLFVCVHNAGRSQMAAGYLQHLAGDRIEVLSAGSQPADQVNPAAVAAMAEEGIDIAGEQPKLLTDSAVQVAHALSTHAVEIDRAGAEVVLGTGERLGYDRLIVATGSESFVPPIDGFGAKGTFVLRHAGDAIGIRSWVQRCCAGTAVVAGGGLLGPEAAYALKRLGLSVTVLERSDRLLRRQLDERGAQLLRRYLRGLGIMPF